MVIRTGDGNISAIDFREKAPANSTRDMYLDSLKNVVKGLSINTHLASGVPGSVDELPEILDTSTARVLDKAWALRVLAVEDAEALRPAVQLYQDVTQILRLCLPGPFDPKTAGPGLLRLLARAADVPDFATLEATLIETQAKVRASFVRILGKAP